ncbi:MAG: S8/S53 family peptidase [Actinobacteria bacterium]|nr:S8/S53 family peptidase [Actinomycetota bacterium]MCA1722441.1 S8/S53 family peptidase [Actinomycetota bacterium]
MRLSRPFLALSVAAALLSPLAVLHADAAAPAAAAGDATVIAVIDSGFSPYHQDFLADYLPAEAAGLPLTKAPDTWLPGFPKPSAFASYSPLKLTLDSESSTNMDKLHDADKEQWASVKESGSKGVNYRWIPGTKVIGALTFGVEDGDRPVDRAAFGDAGTIYGSGGSEHGMGTSSVAVGNLHGACPQCLLVFIQYTDQSSAERALTWAMKQPWIDAISNSYGFSAGVAVRDRVYNGTDIATEKVASERGQTVFFSAGNGLENAFTVPNSTLTSSQEGPDWVVTVGATDPNGKDYTGTGKPADVAGIGTGYPSAYDSTTVSNGAKFGGTSNATPQVAGTYAQSLWQLRRALPGSSRVQAGGVIAKGGPVRCASCELKDGVLTAGELRQRLFTAARPTAGGFTDGLAGAAQTPAVADSRWAAEGYGTFRGTLNRSGDGVSEDVKRVVGPALGTAKAQARPAGETEWFRVDSFCRQHIWGTWSGGAYRNDKATPLPAADPVSWPTRTAIQAGCPALTQPPKPIY